MPSVCRRIAVLLALACMGAALPASTSFAQGAGDQQYQDPFGGSGSSGSSGSKTTTTQSPTLSPKPQTGSGSSGSGSSGSGSSGTSAPAPAPAAAAPAAPSSGATLPNTGVDARMLLAFGAILLLTGIGLRLRTTPERF